MTNYLFQKCYQYFFVNDTLSHRINRSPFVNFFIIDFIIIPVAKFSLVRPKGMHAFVIAVEVVLASVVSLETYTRW